MSVDDAVDGVPKDDSDWKWFDVGDGDDDYDDGWYRYDDLIV